MKARCCNPNAALQAVGRQTRHNQPARVFCTTRLGSGMPLAAFSGMTRKLLGIASDLWSGMRALQPKHYDLQHRTVLVTGGSRGLGLEIARILVAKSASVAIVARDPAEIARAVEELQAA